MREQPPDQSSTRQGSWPVGGGLMAGLIRAFAWQDTPLGPLDGWPQSLKTAVDMILGMPSPAIILWGPQHVQLYNDGFVAIARERHPTLLGQPGAIGWADVFDEVMVPLSAALAGRATQLRDYVGIVDGPPGLEPRSFDADWSPLRDESGEVAGALQTLVETTRRHRAEVALGESEERLHLALAAADLGTFVWHVAEDRTEEDARARSHFGLPPGGTITLAEALATTFHPDDGPRYAAAVARAIDPAGPGTLHEEYRIRHPDGQERWMSTSAITTFSGTPRRAVRLTGVLADVTDRKRAEAALRESEERQAYLLKLSDALRPLTDAAAIQDVAARTLGKQLSVDRAYYVRLDEARQIAIVEQEYLTSEAPSVVGTHSFASYGATLEPLRAGRRVVVEDAETAPDIRAGDRPAYQALSLRAFLNTPLLKAGKLVCAMCVVSAEPRRWTQAEITLVEETAERTWAAVERARAESKLRESEERFQQFADASASGLWIRDAQSLTMEYVSPAISRIYGVAPDALLGKVEEWASFIVPEDRQHALEHLDKARKGEAVIHEFRIQRGADRVFRWIRNTDFPLYGEHGRVERIGGIAEDVTEARLAVQHQGVLLAELQHRVRNIMAIIRSIISRTADGAADVQDYKTLLEGRLMALSRVQTLLTRQANAGAWLRDVIESEVSAQAHPGQQFELVGPDIRLSPKAVEVLTLAFHELATNALKYGALSTHAGSLKVSWAPIDKQGKTWLAVDWTEEGAPARELPRRRGFGSDLIEGRIPYELGGKGKISIGPGGARCHLEFPLKDGDSILATDAPAPTTIFGGTLDMTGAPDLSGLTVLVVEDDYYIAGDTAAALRGAGATVLGACPSEQAALELLASTKPTHAVVDLNLGGDGPRFEIARALTDLGVPYIFITGYDPDAIPAEFADVLRLQKPVQFRRIVEALSEL